MKVLNCGSLNIDRVMPVPEFVRPGETLAAASMTLLPGGKGLNQSLALARAGAEVSHYGAIGEDGIFLKELLADNSVDCSPIRLRSDIASGQAMIQVDRKGENAIVLYAGANHTLQREEFAAALGNMQAGDYLLLQNEVNLVDEFIRMGHEHKLKIVFNPAPFTEEVRSYPLELVDILVVNEIEAAGLGGESSAGEVLKALQQKYPASDLLLTSGSRGSLWCGSNGEVVQCAAAEVGRVVDTTAAGDTFIGYFLAAILRNQTVKAALTEASAASGWCVAHHGAAPSIPWRNEIETFCNKTNH